MSKPLCYFTRKKNPIGNTTTIPKLKLELGLFSIVVDVSPGEKVLVRPVPLRGHPHHLVVLGLQALQGINVV